jgi:hypothetical protein
MCNVQSRRVKRLEHSGGVNQYILDSGDVYFWSRMKKEVGAKWRSACECIREWRSEHSGDLLLSE